MIYSLPHRCERNPPLHTDTKEATTFEKKVTMFRKTLFPLPLPIVMNQGEAQISERNTITWNDATSREIAKAINTSAPNKAHVPDRLNLKSIQQVYTIIPERFNTSNGDRTEQDITPRFGENQQSLSSANGDGRLNDTKSIQTSVLTKLTQKGTRNVQGLKD